MRLRPDKIIYLVCDSGYLGVTLTLADQHHLYGRFFDLAQVNSHNPLPFAVAYTLNNSV